MKINNITRRIIIIIFIIAGSSVSQLFADVSKEQLKIPVEGNYQIIKFTDGSQLMGKITEIGDDYILFKADIGEIKIDIAKIDEIKEIDQSSVRKGEYWFENPNTTRLYFAPTARMLKKGKSYFSDYWIFFPGIAYGLDDNFTIGGGISLFPGVDLSDQVYFFTPKVGISASDNACFAVGALVIALPEIDDEKHMAGILYGVGTFGKPDASITFGAGYGFVDEELADKPMLMIGGEKRFAKRVSFVSENWIMVGVDEPLISYGFRFFGEGISVDLALVNVLGEDMIFPGIPWIDFVVNF